MTRWKREFKRKVEARGFIFWTTPKQWQDWDLALAMSAVVNRQLMQPETVKALDEFVERHLLGYTIKLKLPR